MRIPDGADAQLRGAVLIAGATASGKSALAVRTARRIGGVVVNADSMQVYDGLRILTARPTDEDMAAVPHLLYGHVDPRRPYSAGAWLREVCALIAAGAFDGRPPVFTGGTGLYFKVLLQGLSTMPEIDPAIRQRWRQELAERGAQALHGELSARDPHAATKIRPSDGQRIVRALEVLDSSGRSIREWQGQKGTPIVDASTATRILLDPDRDELARRIDRRFELMVQNGAVEEVQRFSALSVPASMPAAKAIGVRELSMAEAGNISLAEAIVQAQAATRQYAKRQATWFRTQLGEVWERHR